MNNKKYPTYTLMDSTYSYSYEEYKDYMVEMDEEVHEDNSTEFWNWVNRMIDCEYEDLFANLKYSGINDTPCVILGHVGLWDGRHEIVPIVFDNITDAIHKAFGSCDYHKIIVENGIINVYSYHHDGCNTFEIRKFNKKGMAKYEKYGKDMEVKEYMLGKFVDYLF